MEVVTVVELEDESGGEVDGFDGLELKLLGRLSNDKTAEEDGRAMDDSEAVGVGGDGWSLEDNDREGDDDLSQEGGISCR